MFKKHRTVLIVSAIFAGFLCLTSSAHAEVLKTPDQNIYETQIRLGYDMPVVALGAKEPSLTDINETANISETGNYGKLYFDNGYSVNLNKPTDVYNSIEVQGYTDMENSAVYVTDPASGSTMIADHYSQGFNLLSKISVGSHIRIVANDGTRYDYKAISVYDDATWDSVHGTRLPDGRNAWLGDSTLWLKTCHEDNAYRNYVSYWVLEN